MWIKYSGYESLVYFLMNMEKRNARAKRFLIALVVLVSSAPIFLLGASAVHAQSYTVTPVKISSGPPPFYYSYLSLVVYGYGILPPCIT